MSTQGQKGYWRDQILSIMDSSQRRGAQWVNGVKEHYVELRGTMDVNLQLGGKDGSLAVYVADIEDSCIHPRYRLFCLLQE